MTDPVLSSSWCTAWGSYNTPRLWAMVKDEDDPEAWRQVAAWGDISGAMKDQRALLLKARESLVAAWPPEQNKSAEAFVREVDQLIARMDAAKTEADDTATGLANILEALRQAKNNIQPLWEQYKAKSDDLVPAWWDNAEDELDKQAQQHMVTAEQIVQDNVARLRVPDPYVLEPTDPHYRPTPQGGEGGSPGGPSGALGAGASAGARAGSGVTVPVPHDPVPPLPGREPTVPDGPPLSVPDGGPGGAGPVGVGSGPGLAGIINPPVAPPSVNPPGGGLPTPPPGGGGPGIVPPTGPIVGPGIGGVGPRNPGGSLGDSRGRIGGGTGPGGPGLPGAGGGTGGLGVGGLGRGARPGARPEAAGRRALPSGAVIGETVAGAGRAGVGVGGVGGGAGRRAIGRGAGQGVRPPRPAWLPDEPVGAARQVGVPGAARQAGVPGTARQVGTVAGTAGPARGGRRPGDGEQPAFDPDNPWEVAEGVNPVITPGADTARHDPGPNVIGRHG